MGKKALPKARAKAKGRPRALAPVSQKYGYLPPDLQRAGQHMERVAFLRKLQKSIADQNYIRTHGGDSGLSEHGAVGLGEKIEMVASKLLKPKAKARAFSEPHPAPLTPSWPNIGRAASRGRSRTPADGSFRFQPRGDLPGTLPGLQRGFSPDPRRRREPRSVSAAAGSSTQPMVYDL